MRVFTSATIVWLTLCSLEVVAADEPVELVIRPATVLNHRRGAPLDDLGRPWQESAWRDPSLILRGTGGGRGWQDNGVCLWRPMNDLFGSAVDIDGDFLFVAAAAEGRGEHYGGAVYVYRRQDEVWRFTQKITGPRDAPWLGGDDPDGPGFAALVGRDGLLFVGTPGDGRPPCTLAGAVHIFERCEQTPQPLWCFAQTLRPRRKPAPGGHNFGEFLGVDGDWALVASHRSSQADAADEIQIAAGSVEVFRKNARGRWQHSGQVILSPDGPEEGMLFGGAVAVHGDHALIGEPLRANPEGGPGRVHAFEQQGGRWVHVQSLACADPASGAFGVSLAVHGDRAVIGTYCNRCDPMAFFYAWNGQRWEVQQEVLMEKSSIFGASVDLSGELAVIGAPGESDDGSGAGGFHGAAYVLRQGDDGKWSTVARLSHPQPRPQALFGGFFSNAVAVDGSYVAVGTHTEPWLVAPHLGLAPEMPGSAVLFEVTLKEDQR